VLLVVDISEQRITNDRLPIYEPPGLDEVVRQCRRAVWARGRRLAVRRDREDILAHAAHLDRERHVRRGRDARIGPRVCLCFAFEFLKNLADG
jgi:hypothetical protein